MTADPRNLQQYLLLAEIRRRTRNVLLELYAGRCEECGQTLPTGSRLCVRCLDARR